MSENSGQTRVVAAIPNYNMADYLARLLPQVIAQGYDDVFVLDDASTDNSAEVADRFGEQVSFIRSPRNQGAAANRNQIIGLVDDDTLIHFIDADMDLETANSAAIARELMAKYAPLGVGAVGGLVCDADGFQEPYNYGPVFSLYGTLTGWAPPLVYGLRNRPKADKLAARLARPALRTWPRILETPVPNEAYWLHEGNMVVRAGVFRAVGGYDPAIREHETQDLALRMDGIGAKRYFDPSIKVVHHHVAVRGIRTKQQAKSVMYLFRKHGFTRWVRER